MFGGLFNNKKNKQDDDWGKPLEKNTDTSKNPPVDEAADTKTPNEQGNKRIETSSSVPQEDAKQSVLETMTEEPKERSMEKELETKENESEKPEEDLTEKEEGTEHQDTNPIQQEASEKEDVEAKTLLKDTADAAPKDEHEEVDPSTDIPEESKHEPELNDAWDPASLASSDNFVNPLLKDDTKEEQSGRTHFLDDFAIDITHKAADKKLGTIVERDAEIEKLIHILLRSKKNYPMIIGEPGVGKSSIVYGLAQRITEENVPPELKEAYIIQIDNLSLAGIFDKKELEFNLENLFEKIEQARGKIVLLLDDISKTPEEIHQILSMLKSFLIKNETQLIICANSLEYQRFLAEDSFFQDMFEKILIEELSEETTIHIIQNMREKFEKFHSVTFDEDAITRAVFLSKRYVGEEFLPEKAIDIIDDAATFAKVEQTAGKRQDNHVKKDDIEKIISDQTGIAITTLIQDETEVLLNLEEHMHTYYVDQQHAVRLVADTIRKGRSALAAKNKPVASFLFLGPSGTGKTKLAKVLATILYGTENALIQFDISQENYRDKLLEAVYTKPYSLIFLKDLETAHQKTLATLIEILNQGKAIDHRGNVVLFQNTLIICTSRTEKNLPQDTQHPEETISTTFKNLQTTFKPELVNSFDEILSFEPVTQEMLQAIASLQIQALNERLMKENISLAVSDKVLVRIAKEAYNPDYGAHLLEKAVESLLENPIATLLLGKTFVANDTINVTVDPKNGTFVFAKTMRNLEESTGEPLTAVATSEKETERNDSIAPDVSEEKPSEEETIAQRAQSLQQEEEREETTDDTTQDHEDQQSNTEPHPLSFDTYHQQVKHAYSDLLSSLKKN